MGGSTNTVQSNSPLDIQRARAAGRLSPDVMYAIIRGMRGMASPKEKMGNLNMQQQFKHQMGRMGAMPGDMRMHEFFRQSQEGMTYPRMDAMNAALQMYTGIPGVGGGSSTTNNPGAAGYMGGLGNLMMAGGMANATMKGMKSTGGKT